jgi:DNA gyrase/topoisomerase IV subunit A
MENKEKPEGAHAISGPPKLIFWDPSGNEVDNQPKPHTSGEISSSRSQDELHKTVAVAEALTKDIKKATKRPLDKEKITQLERDVNVVKKKQKLAEKELANQQKERAAVERKLRTTKAENEKLESTIQEKSKEIEEYKGILERAQRANEENIAQIQHLQAKGQELQHQLDQKDQAVKQDGAFLKTSQSLVLMNSELITQVHPALLAHYGGLPRKFDQVSGTFDACNDKFYDRFPEEKKKASARLDKILDLSQIGSDNYHLAQGALARLQVQRNSVAHPVECAQPTKQDIARFTQELSHCDLSHQHETIIRKLFVFHCLGEPEQQQN